MSQDTLLLGSQVAKQELALLRKLKVGDVRQGMLFPALEEDMEWVCMATAADRWELEGRFVGQPLFKAVVTANGDALVLDVEAV